MHINEIKKFKIIQDLQGSEIPDLGQAQQCIVIEHFFMRSQPSPYMIYLV